MARLRARWNFWERGQTWYHFWLGTVAAGGQAAELVGTAGATATASASLTTAISLVGSASTTVAATADLTTAIACVGVASVSASASASLTTAISLVGSASTSATGTGNLTTAISLVGAASISASAAALLIPYISGTTKDSTGSPLASCAVRLFRTSDNTLVDESTSNGSGLYVLEALGTGPFFVVAYKAGSPDVCGTTVNTLEGA